MTADIQKVRIDSPATAWAAIPRIFGSVPDETVVFAAVYPSKQVMAMSLEWDADTWAMKPFDLAAILAPLSSYDNGSPKTLLVSIWTENDVTDQQATLIKEAANLAAAAFRSDNYDVAIVKPALWQFRGLNCSCCADWKAVAPPVEPFASGIGLELLPDATVLDAIPPLDEVVVLATANTGKRFEDIDPFTLVHLMRLGEVRDQVLQVAAAQPDRWDPIDMALRSVVNRHTGPAVWHALSVLAAGGYMVHNRTNRTSQALRRVANDVGLPADSPLLREDLPLLLQVLEKLRDTATPPDMMRDTYLHRDLGEIGVLTPPTKEDNP